MSGQPDSIRVGEEEEEEEDEEEALWRKTRLPLGKTQSEFKEDSAGV